MPGKVLIDAPFATPEDIREVHHISEARARYLDGLLANIQKKAGGPNGNHLKSIRGKGQQRGQGKRTGQTGHR